MIEQVGGTHYQRLNYQTWDFIADFNLDYFSGNAIKYLSRYKFKNGDEDIKKAISYIEKIKESRINTTYIDLDSRLIKLYLNQFDDVTSKYIELVLLRRYDELLDILRQ